MVDPARKRVLIDRSSTSFKPGKKAGSHVAGNLKHIANPDLDEVTAAKLAVDREIEQGTVLEASLAIKEEADRPDLLLGERTLGADFLSGIPSCALAAGMIGMAHVSSTRP